MGLETCPAQVRWSQDAWVCELEVPPVGCCSLTLREQQEAAERFQRSWWQRKPEPLCEARWLWIGFEAVMSC